MNKRTFYRDVLNEGGPASFEEAVFRKTVGTARRTRRARVAGRAALIVLAAGLLGTQLWPGKEAALVTNPPETENAAASHGVIQSQTFPAIIRTAALPAERILATAKNSALVVKTGELELNHLEWINDEQLLALFKGQAVALVGQGTGHAELVFLDEKGQP